MTRTTAFHLRFAPTDIPYWAARYGYPAEATIEVELAPAARDRGYLTYDDLVALGEWKSPRIRSRIAANNHAFVEAVTRVAFTAADEQLRIEVLTLLRGVGWPMASVILHWCAGSPGHANRYPILDYRALWSLGIDTSRYDFPFWRAYTDHCRELAGGAGVSMRELDRALWQYAWEKQ